MRAGAAGRGAILRQPWATFSIWSVRSATGGCPRTRSRRFAWSAIRPLFARYDLSGLAHTITPLEIARRPAGLWRWTELLPVEDDRYRLTLGEGDTPLLPAPRLAASLGLEHLYIKDEGLNPTGSFKARGMAVALSRAAELGIRQVVVPTAGNAGGAMAAYAARAGLTAHVILPADAHPAYRAEAERAGAQVTSVNGLIDLAGREASRMARERGASTWRRCVSPTASRARRRWASSWPRPSTGTCPK